MILLLNILIFSIFQECEDMLGYTGMVGYVKNMLKQDGTEQGHTQIRFRLSKGGPFSIESHHAKLQHIRFCSTA